MRVGVLALQGGVAPHVAAARALGHDAVELRRAADARGVEGLVLPGGESTAQRRLLAAQPGLRDAIDRLARWGAPVLATCAGLVLIAREVDGGPGTLGWLDVAVRRNGWGRQRDSAEAVADDGAPLVLIRAPRIVRVGPAVEVVRALAGEPVLVRQGALVGATYHPELTADLRVHRAVFGDARAEAGAGADVQ